MASPPAAPPAGPRTLIVIPTYNEREILPSIVQAVRAAVPAATIMVVDDNSPDGTGKLADELMAQDPAVRVLHRPGKQGLGAAYKDAFRVGLAEGWDRIVQMDADFSHDPKDVPRLLAALDQGADLAIGSRYVAGGGTENWGLGRKVVSRGGGLYARLALGVSVQDLTAGFKAWRTQTLRGIDLQAVSAKGYGFQIEMTYRALRNGFRATEVPILFVDRRVGQSKMTGGIALEALTLVWRLRLAIPEGRG
jgi:dolichol-phosphate mannosyltransferase